MESKRGPRLPLRPGPLGGGSLLQLRKNSGSKKSKVQKLGRVGKRIGEHLWQNPSGVQMLLSQALINVTKTYVTTPEQD